MSGVGVLIRQCRREARLSQRQLAQRVGTSQPMLVRYESGQTSPTVAALERIVRACGQDLRIEHHHRPAGAPVAMGGPVGQAVMAQRSQIRRLVAGCGASRPHVFGSVARGTDTADSDLDLLVDFPVREQGLLPLADLEDQISDLIGYPVDVVARAALADKVAATAHEDLVAL